MLVLKRTKTFLKDSKKVSLSDKHYTRFVHYLGLLAQQELLPEESKDHALKGEWGAYREFHVSGDVLVIYRINTESETVELVRLVVILSCLKICSQSCPKEYL